MYAYTLWDRVLRWVWWVWRASCAGVGRLGLAGGCWALRLAGGGGQGVGAVGGGAGVPGARWRSFWLVVWVIAGLVLRDCLNGGRGIPAKCVSERDSWGDCWTCGLKC